MNSRYTTSTFFILFLLLFSIIQKQYLTEDNAIARVSYASTDNDFPNPERGFYIHYAGIPDGTTLKPHVLQGLRDDNISIIHRSYNISAFRATDLTPLFIDQIEKDLEIVRDAGLKTNIQFRYSMAIGDPDAPLEIIKRHLEQLKPVLVNNYDVIHVATAGFIGAWGEWHNSSNDLDNPGNMREVLFKWLEVLPKDRMVVVRTPRYKFNVFERVEAISEKEAFNKSNLSRTGHYNAAFLASHNDMNTYNYNDITFEKNYINQESRFVPMGGETGGVQSGEYYKCENALSELEHLRWSYLNSVWYPPTLQSWRDDGCMPEIKRRLGYRFVLKEGSFSEQAPPGGILSLNLDLKNVGFAAPYNPRGVQVILRNFTDPDEMWEITLPEDPRYWQAGESVHLSYELGIPEELNGFYEVLLNLPDPAENLRNRSEFSVRMANENVWEKGTGFNRLDHFIHIDTSVAGEEYDGELKFVAFGTWDGNSVSVESELNQDIPLAITLKQNYPNPFNPSTTISFDLQQEGHVLLEVFNIIGERVAVLIDEHREGGSHQVAFDMKNLSSGIYIYTLTSGQTRKSHTMTLFK
ncbi:MAG: DUF4832 domain-containing protein [Balneolales bacterium]